MIKKVILFCCSVSCIFFCRSMVIANKEINNQLDKPAESPKNKLKEEIYKNMIGLTDKKESKEKLAAQVLFANHNKQPSNNCRYPTTKIGSERK